MRGFADRVAVADALRWLDTQAWRPEAEEIAVDQAAGRVLAAPISAPEDMPPADCAAIDGFAVQAQDSLGAGDYDPAVLTLTGADGPVLPGRAAPIVAGMELPPGADAILPFEWTQAQDNRVELFVPAAEGEGVARRAQQLRAGATLLDSGRELRPGDLGALSGLGIDRVAVLRRPRVRLVVAAPKGIGRDANGPLLQSLVARDGGLVVEVAAGLADQAAIAERMAAPGADLILVAGRSGTGSDDVAPLALAAIGQTAIHGIALQPGGSTGMGLARNLPVILLPGDPLACLVAYEIFAGRLIRLSGGRGPDFPHRVCEAELAGKIASAVGCVEFRQMRLARGRAEPLAVPETGGLAAALGADGFLVVPAPLEGYAPGARVRVHLYDRGWQP
ncbi:MAG TPA: molybdopterin molybdotransferase MoeA [Stellaceae bacterium]|nr:molybdopterin molybdotransferase MoeA [Stellaceae bacterium]